ncbi:MAG: hypothetical protein LKG47_04850, partial [Acetobacter fabarum]|nr:hypothetical protein [Acetobacter fabarum]
FRLETEAEDFVAEYESIKWASSRQKERLSDVTTTGVDNLGAGKKCQPNGSDVGRCVLLARVTEPPVITHAKANDRTRGKRKFIETLRDAIACYFNKTIHQKRSINVNRFTSSL